MPIRVLTLKQPYASLMAQGLKFWETRPPTITWGNYRGLVAIHAGAGSFATTAGEAKELLSIGGQSHPDLDPIIQTVSQLPQKQILAVGRLIDSQIMTSELINTQSHRERCVGDWQVGRRALLFDCLMQLRSPIPYRGMQGLVRIRPACLASFLVDTWEMQFQADSTVLQTQLTLW